MAQDEQAWIRRVGARLTAAAPDFGDDMSLVPGTPGLLWSTDMIADGVDFRSSIDDWKSIGFKVLAVNLSDVAAMGATPVAALFGLFVQAGLPAGAADRMLDGLLECATRYHFPVVGGDTNSWTQPTVLSVTVAARAGRNGPVNRRGARVGDHLYVTGKFGGSIRGRHLAPQPRIREGAALAEACSATAMIDVSDGLSIDLSRLCQASGVAAIVRGAALQAVIHDDAHRLAPETGRPALTHALGDGEDFELAATTPHAIAPDVLADLNLTCLGRIESGEGVWLEDDRGERAPLPVTGWEHRW